MNRTALTYWHWVDKPLGEREAIRTVLMAAGLNMLSLQERGEGNDPPDCEAMIEGKRFGIEHTELVDQRTLEETIRGHRVKPPRPARHFNWQRDTFLSALQGILDEKNGKLKNPKGGPYDCFMLVIVTDEPFLYRAAVYDLLLGVTFSTTLIDEAYLGLSYHPGPDGSGSCPVFRLQLIWS